MVIFKHMNFEANIQRKPVNYGRDGQGHIDIEKKRLETMEELKNGTMPAKKEEFIDLGAQLNQELDAELGEFTPEKIKAITDSVRSRFESIEAARKKYQSQGIVGENLENLMSIAKKEALEFSGVTDEMKVANEALESAEIQKNKQILNAAIEHLNSL